jgi:hypothetical protein
MLPCFMIFFVFLCCDLCICWAVYILPFSIVIYLVINLLLRSQAPLSLGGAVREARKQTAVTIITQNHNRCLNITKMGNLTYSPSKERGKKN